MITDTQILSTMPDRPVTLGWLNERLPERVSRARLEQAGCKRCGPGYVKPGYKPEVFNNRVRECA